MRKYFTAAYSDKDYASVSSIWISQACSGQANFNWKHHFLVQVFNWQGLSSKFQLLALHVTFPVTFRPTFLLTKNKWPSSVTDTHATQSRTNNTNTTFVQKLPLEFLFLNKSAQILDLTTNDLSIERTINYDTDAQRYSSPLHQYMLYLCIAHKLQLARCCL